MNGQFSVPLTFGYLQQVKNYKPRERGERMEYSTTNMIVHHIYPTGLVVLVANVKKYQFSLFHMGYLSHLDLVRERGSGGSFKVAAMEQCPPLRNIKVLYSFLGLTTYYCEFVANNGIIAFPLA